MLRRSGNQETFVCALAEYVFEYASKAVHLLAEEAIMSLVHDRLQRSSDVVRTWYLKDPAGLVYGPVDLSLLCEWSVQGRVVPGSEVSENAQAWMPAENLSDLKLEWMAELPEGGAYGPFNVLAVPFLSHNGTLPAGAKLVNRTTGKTLLVREMLKPAVSPDAKGRGAASSEKDRAWEERYHEENRKRLESEAQLQQVAALREAQERILREAQERILRERAECERLQVRTRAAEVQVKQAFESGKAETLAKGREDEARFKARIDKLDRDLQVAGGELAEQRKRCQMLEKEASQRETRCQSQADDFKKKSDSLAAEIARLRKEAESQRSLHAESEKSVAGRESELKKDALIARAAAAKAEQELDAFRKQHEAFRKESGQKERDLSVRSEQLLDRAGQAEGEAERLTQKLAEKISRVLEAEDRLKNAAGDVAGLRSTLSELQARYDAAGKESAARRDAMEQQVVTLGKDRSALVETGKRLEGEKAALAGRVSELESESQRLASQVKRAAQNEKDLRLALNESLRSVSTEVGELEVIRKQREDEAAGLRRALEEMQAAGEKSSLLLAQARERELELERELADQKASCGARVLEEDGLKRRCAVLEEDLRKKDRQVAAALRKLEEEQTLFSGIQATETQKESELGQRLRATLEENEQIAAELQAQKARHQQMVDENTAVLQKIDARAISRARQLDEVTAARDQAARELETTKVSLLTTIKGLEKQVAAKSDERQAAERRAEAFSEESNRIHLEMQALRQQHEALQGIIRGKDRAPAQREEPALVAGEGSPQSKYLRAALAVAAAIVCSVIAFQWGVSCGRGASAHGEPEMDSSTLPETIVDPTRAAEEKPPPAAPKQSITWPIVSVEGVKVTTSDRECAMVFDSGVFSYRTTISPEAAKALRAVAGQVRGSLADLTLVIEGHADMTPASAATGDNNSLSLARANVVLDFLKSQCELPAASMTATSKGADDPPYSNDDEASRLKNRTVILRLVPQDRK